MRFWFDGASTNISFRKVYNLSWTDAPTSPISIASSRMFIHRKSFAAFVSALVAFFTCTGPAAGKVAQEVAIVSIRFNQNTGLMHLPVEVNSVSGNLMVDSGAAGLMLDSRQAGKLKVKTGSTLLEANGVNGKTRVLHGKVTIAVPGHAQVRLPATALFCHLPRELQSFGVIGMEELENLGAVVDCRGERLMLYSKGRKFSPPPGYEGVRCKWYLGQLLAPIEIEGKSGLMLVDTGATHSAVSLKLAQKAGVQLLNYRSEAIGVGGNVAVKKAARIPNLRIGGVDTGAVDVLAFELYPPLVGVIGLSELRRLRAFLDCRSGVLYVRR